MHPVEAFGSGGGAQFGEQAATADGL